MDQSPFMELVPYGGPNSNLWEQIGVATFTTTATQITTIPTNLTNIHWGVASPTGTSVNANDVIAVEIGAVSSNTFTVTRPSSGTSGLSICYRIVGEVYS